MAEGYPKKLMGNVPNEENEQDHYFALDFTSSAFAIRIEPRAQNAEIKPGNSKKAR